MKTTEDKAIDNWVDHWMQEAKLESPSEGFTQKIMSTLPVKATNTVTTYQPLLSSYAILGIVLAVVSIVLYSVFTSANTTISWVPKFNVALLSHYFSWNMPQFSKITTYCFVATTILVFIQIPFLKHYYEKKHTL